MLASDGEVGNTGQGGLRIENRLPIIFQRLSSDVLERLSQPEDTSEELRRILTEGESPDECSVIC